MLDWSVTVGVGAPVFVCEHEKHPETSGGSAAVLCVYSVVCCVVKETDSQKQSSQFTAHLCLDPHILSHVKGHQHNGKKPYNLNLLSGGWMEREGEIKRVTERERNRETSDGFHETWVYCLWLWVH